MAKPTPFAGSQEPFQIFNDDFFESITSAPMMSHAPMPAVTKPHRRPLSSSNSNVILNPPSSYASVRQSPIKASGKTSSPLTALKPAQGNKLGMVNMAPPPNKGANSTDSLQKKPFLSKFKTVAQKPMTEPTPGFGKENIQPHLFPAPPTINFDNYCMPLQKGPGKRMLMEAAPIKDARAMKKVKVNESGIPPHDSYPPITDDGTKPGHSYAQLIGMAILRSPNRRLTLAQIYKWISDSFKFYKAEEAGWQNSIRHNLSLHKAFVKMERPKDDPGKGNYWTIQEGMEQQFIKDKPIRKNASAAENLPVMSTRLEPSRPMTAPLPEPTLPPSLPTSHIALPQVPTSQATIPAEVSSDATIPISDDHAGPEDAGQDKNLDNELPSSHSPLPAPIHSSPPVPRHMGSRSRTPPPVSRMPATSSINRSHKRKYASMDDSGYISSLESSAMRPTQHAMGLTSEADRPRSKRSRGGREGRAELEIARLRASSYDSPSKGRSYNALPPPSSSPFRTTEGQMLPPLTPAMKLKPPTKPPPSASPNTNLQIHRDKVRAMLQSPIRKISGSVETTPWSPAFNLDSAFDLNQLNYGDFDLWPDVDEAFLAYDAANNGSPCKKSAKRPRVDRSQSTTALTEATGSGNNGLGITSTPLLRAPSTQTALTWDTPSKVFSGLDSPSKIFGPDSPSKVLSPPKITASLYELPNENFFPGMFDGADLLGEDTENFPLDICQGFEKIGSGTQASKNNQKPTLSRSFTSRF